MENKHHKEERTFVIIKPDGVQRSLIGEIIKRYEKIGLKLIGRKTGEKTIVNYKEKGAKPPSDDPIEITKIVLKNLKKYMTSGPVIIMVWQGAHAVGIVRKITGTTEPLTSDVGTI